MTRKQIGRLALTTTLAAVLAAGTWAQTKAPDAQETAKLGPASNPVSAAVKAQLPRFSKNMVAAAEAMPAEKFNFKPTPEMNSFAHLVMHIAQSNNGLCSKISDTPAPEVKLADTDPKDKLVAGSLKTKVQGVANKVLPDSVKAAVHGRMAEPESAD
jgi:hypothetical protein